MPPKDADRMLNSIDLDQTTPLVIVLSGFAFCPEQNHGQREVPWANEVVYCA